jgi:hypothetical protein
MSSANLDPRHPAEPKGSARQSARFDQLRLPLVFTVEEKRPIGLASEEPSCTRWSVPARLSRSGSVVCVAFRLMLW